MISDKYKIKNIEGEDIKPEETLADSLSAHSAIEVPISRNVFGLFYAIIVVVLLFFGFKSFQLQILNGKQFAASVEQNSSSAFRVSAPRGVIYDSTGRPIAENIPIFDLVAVHSALPKSANNLKDELNRLAPVTNLSLESLAEIFKNNQDKAVFTLKTGLSKEEVARIKTLSPAGVYVVATAKRHYPQSFISAHLIGYTSMVTSDDMKSDGYYFINDRIGRLGLEAEYEKFLRGGHQNIDLTGNNIETIQNTKTGQNLFININSEVQSHLFSSISSVFNSAGVRRGAAIVQNAKTGAVLALVSMPTFSNDAFENYSESGNSSKITQTLKNSDKPLLNRAISGRYSPGSTIKPLLAMAGLKENVVTPTTTIYANGSISIKSEIDPNVTYTFKDWRVHGLTDLKKAIADSVDVYFYALGGGYGNIKGLGISKIADYLKNLLADKPTGIDLPGETAGFVPSEEWKKSYKGEAWYIGDTYNISIGQGDLVVTPIWLNTYIGSIANGGNLMKPYIVSEIRDPDNQTVVKMSPEILGKLPFDEQTINIVRQGMRQAVTSGTSTLLQDLPVPVAAKTGTAQISNRGLNSLFTVFGPYDNPEIVMTVLVENISQSQGLAIRVANDFLSWYFKEFKK